jgi:APA family basic amino acid/polyamine antiporter
LTELKRELGVLDAFLLIAGSIIGAGVFIAPNLVAQRLDSGPWILAAWAGGGVLSLLGALVFAELCAMFPAAGGQYVYLREAFGTRTAFLFGWSSLLVIYSAAIAWMAVSFSIWLGQFVQLSETGQKVASLGLIAGACVLNARGVRSSARMQDGLTLLKLVSLAAVVVMAFGASGATTQLAAAPLTASPLTTSPVSLAGFGLALIGCLLSYDGWSNAGLMAGEMRHPQRDLPRALVAGVALVMTVYLLANAAYLRLLTPGEIAAADRVAAVAMERVAGPPGGRLVAFAIVLSSAGVCFAWLLSAPRLYYAMARDGCFFPAFGRLHPAHGTPANAIALQGVVAGVLALTGSYQTLAAYAMFSAWFFYALTTAGLFRLRVRRPDLHRPFRAPGYPWLPALFLLAAAGFLGNTLVENPRPALIAVALMLAGVPAYRFWSKSNG